MSAAERTYDQAEIAERLQNLPGWTYDGGALRREYGTDGWKSTVLVMNAIAFVAEAAGHHPDLHVTWSRITVKLWTHSAGGITDKDFEAAAAIETAVRWQPGPRGALKGTPLVRDE